MAFSPWRAGIEEHYFETFFSDSCVLSGNKTIRSHCGYRNQKGRDGRGSFRSFLPPLTSDTRETGIPEASQKYYCYWNIYAHTLSPCYLGGETDDPHRNPNTRGIIPVRFPNWHEPDLQLINWLFYLPITLIVAPCGRETLSRACGWRGRKQNANTTPAVTSNSGEVLVWKEKYWVTELSNHQASFCMHEIHSPNQVGATAELLLS